MFTISKGSELTYLRIISQEQKIGGLGVYFDHKNKTSSRREEEKRSELGELQ